MKVPKIFLTIFFMAVLVSACGEKTGTQLAITGKGGNIIPVPASGTAQTAASKPNAVIAAKAAPSKTHEVKKGEFLNAIADHYGVEREGLILANSKMLIERFEKTCLRAQPKTGKLFCNENYKRAWANTLLPGWVIQIPDGSLLSSDLTKSFGAEKVKALDLAVNDLGGTDSLAVLLDVSGSMDSSRQNVAQYVIDTLRKSNKKFAGLYVYSENVKSIKDAVDDTRLRNALTKHYPKQEVGDNSRENTHKALKYVFADKKATHVLVISDEVGDDWNWATVKDMRNVIAVCVKPVDNNKSCGLSFKRLAKEAPGSKYILL